MSVRNGEGVPEGYNLGAVAGRAFERERIIALIENNLEDAYGDGIYAVSDLIARIKGEQ